MGVSDRRALTFQHWFRRAALKIYNSAGEECSARGIELVCGRRVERFLDAGCGDGLLTTRFAQAVGALEVHGIEYADEPRRVAMSRGINCVQQDLNDPWEYPQDYFDLVLSSMNIEHMHNTRLYLEECMRCLRPGGQVLILTENLASLLNLGAMVLGWQPFSTSMVNGWFVGLPSCLEVTDHSLYTEYLEKWQLTGVSGAVGHVRVLTYCGLQDLLEKTGFLGVKTDSIGYLPFWGWVSTALGYMLPRHGHFLAATGFKP